MSSYNSASPSKGSITKSSSDNPTSSPPELKRKPGVTFHSEKNTVLTIPSENRSRPVIRLKDGPKKQVSIESGQYILVNKARIERAVLVTHEDASDDWEMVSPLKDLKDHDATSAERAKDVTGDERVSLPQRVSRGSIDRAIPQDPEATS
ncbi:hypothetical protein FHETE_1188 [Fusarium heterosporum]|uniref:Uncharacterized protein n=1 Tax=Fusarium heterosporum TaxID=42747 RepID=A0A8H5X152_FUSHE|nr:hypothetical protein FHETE_1188 [Fusarium heterosporum]